MPPAPGKPVALPTTPREYHEFFRTLRFRWWKPLAAIGMFVACWLLLSVLVSVPLVSYEITSGRADWTDYATGTMTPMLFTINNIVLGLAIPLSGLAGWVVFGQRPRWISSIAGGFRWGLFGRFALICAPLLLASFGIDLAISGVPELAWNPDSLFLIVVILLTTPFQAAGEEYGVRGLLARSIGSWFGSSRVGLLVAMTITSLVFMGLHAAEDPWLNGYYFAVGVVCSLLVWRTGGLEAAVALHVCNNMIGEVTLPFGDLAGMFDRSAGVAGPSILIQVFFMAAAAAGMWWLAKRSDLARSAAPAALPDRSDEPRQRYP